MVWFKKYYFLIALIVIYAGCIIYINPFKNFPLNDDWAYAWSAKQLLEHHELRISDWVSPTSVFHILWGSLFAYILGFHHGILRLATLTMSLIGGVFLYKTLKKTGLDERRAIWGTLLLVFNPLYFVFSFTFHTDVTFISLGIITIYLYQKAIQDGDMWFWIGAIFSSFAFLTRQLGLALPIGIFLVLLHQKKLTL